MKSILEDIVLSMYLSGWRGSCSDNFCVRVWMKWMLKGEGGYENINNSSLFGCFKFGSFYGRIPDRNIGREAFGDVGV